MKPLDHLFKNNESWADQRRRESPDFFTKLAAQQSPEYLWVGCSDSRVPANEIVGLLPGELFVHRNVANQVMQTDFNCLAVIHYAVEVLKVKHVIVCGHYGCGGVEAAASNHHHDVIDNWLQGIRDQWEKHRDWIKHLPKSKLSNASSELNVIEQVFKLSKLNAVQKAWENNQPLTVHGWIYGLDSGNLVDLNCSINKLNEAESTYWKAIDQIKQRSI